MQDGNERASDLNPRVKRGGKHGSRRDRSARPTGLPCTPRNPQGGRQTLTSSSPLGGPDPVEVGPAAAQAWK